MSSRQIFDGFEVNTRGNYLDSYDRRLFTFRAVVRAADQIHHFRVDRSGPSTVESWFLQDCGFEQVPEIRAWDGHFAYIAKHFPEAFWSLILRLRAEPYAGLNGRANRHASPESRVRSIQGIRRAYPEDRIPDLHFVPRTSSLYDMSTGRTFTIQEVRACISREIRRAAHHYNKIFAPDVPAQTFSTVVAGAQSDPASPEYRAFVSALIQEGHLHGTTRGRPPTNLLAREEA